MGNFTNLATNATIPRQWDNQWPNFDNVGNALLVRNVASGHW